MSRISTLRTKRDSMTPTVFAQAIASIDQKYGLRLDARSVWLRMDATPCGRGWVGTKPPGCKRGEREKTTAAKSVKGAEPKTPEVKVAKTKAPAKEVKIKTPELEINESEVLKSTLQRLKAKLEESIAKDKASNRTASTPSSPAISVPVKTKGTDIAPYTVKKTLGSGAFGTAELTDRGTVVKTGFNASAADIQREFDAVRHIHSLGIGPEAIGINSKSLEIGLIRGNPMSAVSGDESLMESAKALLKLHRSGWSHNDAHDENLIFQKDGKVKLIDAGMAVPVGTPIPQEDDFFEESSPNPIGRAGIVDIERIAHLHPAVRRLKEALRADLDEHREATEQASRKTDESKRSEMNKAAEIKLHKAYLAIADQYIK